ncbi:MAG: hypothetical protein RIC51_04450, partial [Erythrobacter sp.]
MASITNPRARLMLGCGGAALALSLALSPGKAQAQAFQATDSVVQGSATRTVTGANSETITVDTPTAVIDWTPQEDGAGDALDFLPTGATATFENNGSLNPGADFAVLNRILPSTNGNIVVMDGTVISRIVDLSNGSIESGGTVAFYSPTGLLIGGNASFDVGNLILTTLEPDLATFDAFTTGGGTLQLFGEELSTARIRIEPGAQVTASSENSYFAVVAAGVEMFGTTDVNGSQAFVAGELVNLTFSNGLFDIEVPIGTALPGTVLEVNGDVGAPSSTGIGDNHLIYGVARAAADPIRMLFSGNLGFDPAASAGVVNGEIILSANFDVFGRSVAGDSTDAPNPRFEQAIDPFGPPTPIADIQVEDFAASSSLLAIGTDIVDVSAQAAPSSVEGSLFVVGREAAQLTAANGQAFDISGDVLVSAANVGVVSSSLQDPTVINAVGGSALVEASGGAAINIAGNARVIARAIGGAEDTLFEAGTATGGSALVSANGGDITILGDTEVDATAQGTTELSLLQTGATSTGGSARAVALNGGALSFGGALTLDASADGVDVDTFNPSTGSDAFGGFASLDVTGTDGGTIDISSVLFVLSNATGGDSNEAGAGAIGDAGNAGIFVDGPGVVTIGGGANLLARGEGGLNAGGVGGDGLGGSARAFLPEGGTLDVLASLSMNANAIGGNGITGGDALGGAAGIEVVTGIAEIADAIFASADAEGGNADFGFGGDGGDAFGGLAFVQATGTLDASATLDADAAFATSRALGGRGGVGDGSTIAPGRGGDATGGDFGTFNQAAPDFNNGAFVLAGGDNGNLTIAGGDVEVDASAEGGEGGSGSAGQNGGEGGIGTGGLAQAGLALFEGDGSLAQGSADFGLVFMEADGVGGSGGSGDLQGNGGEGRGGTAAFTVSAGTVAANSLEMFAEGFGGNGEIGGLGLGGLAGILGELGGVLTIDNAELAARGFGGAGNSGGAGTGGEASVDLEGIDLTINGDAELDATGE